LTLDTAYGASYGVYGRYYHPGTNYYGAYKVTAYYSAYNGAYVAPPSYYLGYKVYY
jgi:hypothetical protein